MNSALGEIRDSGTSIRAAAKKYNIPRGTIQDRLHNRVENGAKLGRPTQLAAEDEQKLVDFAGNRAALGIGCNKKSFMKFAGDLARKRSSKFKKGSPSEKWWRLMVKRHRDLTLRKPEGTAAIRHSCMNPSYVASYFKALHTELASNKLLDEPTKLWNMDETGCSLSHSPGKVCARTGAKHLQARVSGNRETVTLLCAGNAAGDVIPPHMVIGY